MLGMVGARKSRPAHPRRYRRPVYGALSLTLHSMRHTAATWALAGGADVASGAAHPGPCCCLHNSERLRSRGGGSPGACREARCHGAPGRFRGWRGGRNVIGERPIPKTLVPARAAVNRPQFGPTQGGCNQIATSGPAEGWKALAWIGAKPA